MEELSDIIGDFLLSIVLDLELLLVELAESVNAAADIVVVKVGARVVIMSELNHQDCVSLV